MSNETNTFRNPFLKFKDMISILDRCKKNRIIFISILILIGLGIRLFIFPYDMNLPDTLKGTDYFTTIFVEDGKNFWHHRELIRYKYGKSKKLTESLSFIEQKYKDLHELVEPLEKDIK